MSASARTAPSPEARRYQHNRRQDHDQAAAAAELAEIVWLSRYMRAAGIANRMSLDFEELDYRPTPIGALSLRRRRELTLGVDVFEIKLGDEFLMSSLFTASEIALARLALAALPNPDLTSSLGGWGSATQPRPCWSTGRSPR
jgi:hypothetical protein